MPPTGPARRGRGRGRGATTREPIASRSSLSSRINNGPMPTRSGSSPLIHLQVTGWTDSAAVKTTENTSTLIRALTQWLERKARVIQDKLPQHAGIQKRGNVRIRKSKVEKDVLHIYVTAEDSTAFSKLDGYEYAQATINIRAIGGSRPARDSPARSPAPGQAAFSFKSNKETESLKETLRQLLTTRYDAETKVLNFSNIGEEPDVKELLKQPNNTTTKLFAALCAVFEDVFPTPEARKEAVTGIILSNNGWHSASIARPLALEFPDIQNLDLSNNKIGGIDGVSHFRRCLELQHIILSGNPIEQTAEFKKDVLRAFPKLALVDGAVITPADREGIQIHGATPKISPGLFEDTTGLGAKFLQTFFAGFDTDRTTLLNYYYDKNSTFSYAVNNQSLRDPSAPKPRKGEWDAWIYNSRNIWTLTSAGVRKSRLHKGSRSIGESFKTLPPTQHASSEDASKWLVESVPISGLRDPSGQSPNGVNGLTITIHGEFFEHPTNSNKRKHRSFDRTFILGPGGNNPDGVGIISDMLVVRSYGGTKAYETGAQVAMSPEEERAAMVAEIMRQTGMNLQYATMCLEQTEWKFDTALESFNQAKANIPPEAFVQ
ncbi:NTF2-like protein [Microthyrium microscopicum]|uniref:mRNA export factor MEX67 n=1 Tax=Microthyrium microscopicum TaxID=703497 RepID=A0A6A6USN7_9PEZI|nr:NTF2-like protein [Microthyrium microscopicum]